MKTPWLTLFTLLSVSYISQCAVVGNTGTESNEDAVLGDVETPVDAVLIDRAAAKDTILSAMAVETLRTAARGGDTWDNYVYRGDARAPEAIKKANGFSSRSKPTGYSLYDHVLAKDLAGSVYISTTELLSRGATYARNALHHPDNKGKKESYVYKIHASQKNFADINRSLRLQHGLDNLEHVALGSIPWSQVQSYAKLTADELSALEQGKMKTKDIKFQANDRYVKVSSPGSLPREKLAGWPEKHAAWEREPWKQLRKLNKGKPFDVKQEYNKLVGKVRRRDVW